MDAMEPTRATAQGKFVDAAGVRTYYEVDGAGEPVVMLHGGFSTIETWQAQRAALAEDYRVYLPERRGHGRTGDVDGPITYENMAADTIAFMAAVGIESAHLVGWSDGGSVGMFVALQRPDLVRKLVCMSAPANFEGFAPAFQAMSQHLTIDVLPPMLREGYEALSPDGPDHLPVVFEKIARLWRTEPQLTLDELQTIDTPTLVLLADDDVVTIEHAAAMARALGDAQLAVVPGTDHLLLFEKPELVNRLIGDFLADKQAPKMMQPDPED